MGKSEKKTSSNNRSFGEKIKTIIKTSSLARKAKGAFTKANVKRYFKERMGTLIVLGVILVFVIWGLISIQIAKNNATGSKNYKDYVASKEPTHDPEELFKQPLNYELVASDDKLELYFDKAQAALRIKDKETGYTWNGVHEDKFSGSDVWKKKVRSSVVISYNDVKARDGQATELSNARACDYLEVTQLENGVSVLYGFTKQGIYFVVEYLLEDGEFVVRIPSDKIVEETRYIINTIIVLPFFGSATAKQEGYMFYPDGCGAITMFNNASNRVQTVKAGMWKTYTTNKITLDYWLMSDDYERYTAAMPVYGIKHGDNAVFTMVSSCDELSGITCEPAGTSNVNLNRIYFNLYIRNQFDATTSSVSTEVGVKSTGRDITRIDKEILQGEREVRYVFLHGEDANYSGMARTYRDYLIKNGALVDTIEDGAKYPLALSFMMGVTERQLVFDKYVVMTSFDNVKEIFEDLKASGVEASKAVLQHWIKDDKDMPSYWPVASQLGGKKGLAELNKYLADNKEFNVFLANNFIFAEEDERGFSATSDVAYTGINMPISSKYMEGIFMLSTPVIYDNVKDFLKKVEDYSNIGVSYTFLGEVVYDDYNEDYITTAKDANGNDVEKILTRQDTIDTWQKILADTHSAGKKTAATGSNQYLYSGVDYLYDVPIANYGLSITDYAVPFTQMVISGLIPYASGTYETGNLTYDLDVQKLEWIEFGALPYFYLTYENALKLKDTGYNFLFTSTYSYWKDRVVETYKEFNENFGDTYGEQMISHEVLSEDVKRVEYSNGKIIYLNYSSEEVIIDGVTIPAIGYTVIGKEAK